MKERPIIFNAEMVRAILDGRKTQTRRILRRQPDPCEHEKMHASWSKEPTKFYVDERGHWACQYCGNGIDWGGNGKKCPYGQPGDRLWVKETFFRGTMHGDDIRDKRLVAYRADSEARTKWRPSIHMPRWASRITLEIVNVRVERLQDITDGGSCSEGFMAISANHPNFFGNSRYVIDPREHFSWGWDKANGPGAWIKNPWVWVIEFKKV